jgi:uncharacterized protein YkwD
MSLRPLLHGILLATLTVAAILAPAAASHAASRTAAAGCSGAQASIAQVSPRVIGGSVLCLVNAERTSRGLRPLRTTATLQTAAQRFSSDMVARRFFDHVSPDGTTVMTRARRAGYRNMSTVGENIGWGTGEYSTPAAVVQGWMNSPPHRAVILNGRFREAGVGVTSGSPVDAPGPGATFVLDVAAR